MSHETIIRKVKYQLHTITAVLNPKRKSSGSQVHILETLGLKVSNPTMRKGIWCRWKVPATGFYKLNVDGSAKDGVCTGGGSSK